MEAKLFPEGAIPEWTTPGWYAGRDAAPHLEQEGHAERLRVTRDLVVDAIELWGANDVSVVDYGAGDGGLLSLLPFGVSRWGYDLQGTNVDAARDKRHETVIYHDVVSRFWQCKHGDIAVATETLEHLVDPHKFVSQIHDTGARYLVASSPYTETAESHYEYHTWAWDQQGYLDMLQANGWEPIRVRLAWISQIVLCRSKP